MNMEPRRAAGWRAAAMISVPAAWQFARSRRLTAAVAAAAALIAAALWFHARQSGAAAPAAETRPTVIGTVERSISASGPVKALVTVDVGSQLSGLIAEMKADFNSRVKAGDLLAVIDRAPFEAKLASASANLAMAKAEVGLREAAVARAKTQIAQNERDATRFELLSPKGVVSQKSRETAQTQLGLAQAELAMAAAQLEAAKAAVAQREADVRQAQIDLNYTLIRSPINGVVVDRRMQPGQTVAAQYQTPILFQIAQDLSQILIYAQVDEADIGAVRPGAPVTFTVEAYPEETFEGTVDQIRLAAAKTGGVITYTVVIKAQNPGERLFPDMTATVRIVGARRENVLSIPNDALRFRPPGKSPGDGPAVWAADAHGALERRPVQLGLKGDTTTEVTGGELKPGEAVAVRMKAADAQ
jgi:HlyD family secretion protein